MENNNDTTEGEIWSAHREEGKKKRWSNRDNSLRILRDHKIVYKILDENTAHYKIGSWNFWPTTGKFYNEKTKEKGRGVFNLLKHL